MPDAAAALRAGERQRLSRSPEYLNKKIFLFSGRISPAGGSGLWSQYGTAGSGDDRQGNGAGDPFMFAGPFHIPGEAKYATTRATRVSRPADAIRPAVSADSEKTWPPGRACSPPCPGGRLDFDQPVVAQYRDPGIPVPAARLLAGHGGELPSDQDRTTPPSAGSSWSLGQSSSINARSIERRAL